MLQTKSLTLYYYGGAVVIGIILLASIVCLLLGAYVTNPFSRLTIVRQPYKVTDLAAGKTRDQTSRLRIRQWFLWRWFAVAACGIHILYTRYVHSPRSRASTLEGIINDIHYLRFQPEKLLVTSGDHFSALFVRNLGVFYYPLIDARLPAQAQDWHDRQVVYLQTVAYALGVFAKRPVPTTTIVPTGRLVATCINFYAYPSDTVYGILYALAALQGLEIAAPANYAPKQHKLATIQLAHELTAKYMPTLQALYAHYCHTVFDPSTGLVRTSLHMSGAKDITRRRSSFYDNVIFWKTTQLAMNLGIIPTDKPFLDELKQRILAAFWLPKQGYFLEDLSAEGVAGAYYSSDWLIVLATNFLRPEHEQDRMYFKQSIRYVQANGIDQPFAIKYQAETRASRQFLPVRVAVASYGGDSIWSFWGMEYIKTLLLLYKHTGRKEYLDTADVHIASYEAAMLRDGGFPEVYDAKGHLLQTPLYRAIRQTGWVVGFEQAKAMRGNLKK